jgi:hypothetical protein
MAEASNEDVVRRYLAAHKAHDFETIARLRHPDWTAEWPQSQERVRGDANDRAIMEHWPAGLPTALAERSVVGAEDRWVMTPAYTFVRVIGTGDHWWFDGTASYPDGSTWYAVGLLQLRDRRLLRETWYFAPPLPAPAWRSQWVERMESPAPG